MRPITRYLLLKTLWVFLCPVIYLFTALMPFFAMFGLVGMKHGFESLLLLFSIAAAGLFVFGNWVLRRLPKTLRNMETSQNFGLRVIPWFVPLYYTLFLVLMAWIIGEESGSALLFAALPANWLLIGTHVWWWGQIMPLAILPLAISATKLIFGIARELWRVPHSPRNFVPVLWSFAIVAILSAAIFFVHAARIRGLRVLCQQ